MIIHGDSFEELKKLDECSIDSLVTDPPYGLSNISHSSFTECMIEWCQGNDNYVPSARGFMGKSWDGFVPPPALWKEVFRVMKQGAHGLVFASSRTQDIMGLSLRLAGFEMRDCVTWLYGTGFPKSHDISKAIDKFNGFKVSNDGYIPNDKNNTHGKGWGGGRKSAIPTPSSKEAKQWAGWGTALKPAYEPALLIRKPFKGSVAQNVLEHGTGALNIDGCRIGDEGGTSKERKTTGANSINCYGTGLNGGGVIGINKGRFPSNLIMDEEASNLLQGQSRFFYCAKSSPSERSAGLNGLNVHPTVKPIEIMRYLCRLITPPEGIVLDPFLGSGTTAISAMKEGFDCIGIEREEEYIQIAQARLEYWSKHDHAMTPQNEQDQYEQMELFK